MRKRKGRPIDGWLVLDKPYGMTSTAALGAARRAFGAAKAGHGGTLDPLATGILPIAFGEATKTVPFIMDGRKAYRFTVRFGIATATDDAEGAATATSEVRPAAEEIRAALPRFRGVISQVPPRFSAIKVAGERAYDLARGGEEPDLKPREVVVHALDLVEMPDADHAVFAAECGKGTYIRSIARDLAAALGTVGHVAALRRTRCGPFSEAEAISLDKLLPLGHSAPSLDLLHSVSTALDDIPALALTEEEARHLANGQALPLLPLLKRSPCPEAATAPVVRAMCGERVVAIARIADHRLQPVRVIHTHEDGDSGVDHAGTQAGTD
ncbi:tRNA pseudouridine(55) synthase TruB [Oleispirillum naphthae]|uniref:tRNA pseudouridine(55) synthase TruB n=1 Tax=Oleispirillum naphthae TaxID=2838853 RepID=UPI003082361C